MAPLGDDDDVVAARWCVLSTSFGASQFVIQHPMCCISVNLVCQSHVLPDIRGVTMLSSWLASILAMQCMPHLPGADQTRLYLPFCHLTGWEVERVYTMTGKSWQIVLVVV